MEILNETMVSANGVGTEVMALLFTVVTAVLFIVAIISAVEKSVGSTFAAVIGCLLFVTFASHAIQDARESVPQYEVLITDFNEVYEQGYEIVDQRGKIYIVRKSESEAN